MIKIKNLTYNYDNKFSALFEINLDISKNTVILSDELSSKTLFRIISKQYTGYSGEVVANNKNLKDTKLKDLSISYITNPPFLINPKSTCYNIAYPLLIRKVNKVQTLEKALSLLSKYNLENKKIKHCSMFEKIKVSLLRTLIRHPQIVLIDDIFLNFTSDELNQVLNIINEISKSCLIVISLNQSQNMFKDYQTIKLFNGKLEE